MPTKLFVPSSEKLLAMIANAERKCDGDIEQDHLRQEARQADGSVRMQIATDKARHYYRIQHGHARPSGW